MAWKSKSQRSVTLSSSKTEWSTFSEAFEDIIFILKLLKMIKIKVSFPIIVRVNNTGAIFMGENLPTSLQTNHVDISTKYVCEYVEDGIEKIIFVRPEDNTYETMTKNIHGNLYDKHSSQLIVARL